MAISTTFHVSKKRVTQAGEFIMEYGREIDKALFAHYFRREPASTVVSMLGRLRKPDGRRGVLPRARHGLCGFNAHKLR